MGEQPDLLPRVARREPGAVEQCLDRYGDLVWSLARKTLRNTDDAEDAVQDIFVELWKVAGRFDPRSSPEPVFIAMLTRRRLVDRLRRRGTQVTAESLDESQSAATMVGDWQSPSLHEQEEEGARAKACLAELEPTQRKVFELTFWQGLTHAEIAAKEQLPLGTVKTLLRRGLIKLRALLGMGEAPANRTGEGP